MLRLLSLIMLVASASIIGWFVIEDQSPILMSHSGNPINSAVEATVTSIDGDSQAPADTAEAEASPTQPSKPNANEWLERFSTLEGMALNQELEAFWLNCQLVINCEEQLAELKPLMADSGYFLLANYLQLKQQWQDSLGSLELNQLATLAEKVAEFQRQANAVWGQKAETLLADQFAAYDFVLESQSLADSSPNDYLAEFQSLAQRWQKDASSVGLDGGVETFETAVSLIPASYSQQQRELVIGQLSVTYLTHEQAGDILARQQQVQVQQQEVLDYQSQLSALKSSLSQQRTSTYGAMTDLDWIAYYNEQIRQFRIEFFKSK
ncbi:hypothetical protein [Vibrio sp. VPAP30]|uniref:hypothetical protein n=1 Tax=Vibrio sp. VPAP30 TaxID=1647102 RepID=UPI000658C6E0|nr:hypothetical protein [Vibrio sp. VPAP30]KLN64981.1 chromosome partitioning protein ParA [Vibrio sp. VPAP30]